MTKKKKLSKTDVLNQVRELFEQAANAFKKSPELAKRFVAKARRLAMSYRIKIPKEFKRKFCKHCYAYLVPGKTVRIRTRPNKVIYYCFSCKKYMRFHYVPRRRLKKK